MAKETQENREMRMIFKRLEGEKEIDISREEFLADLEAEVFLSDIQKLEPAYSRDWVGLENSSF